VLRSNHRSRGHVILILPFGVFQQGLVELVRRALGVAEVVEGGSEDVFPELEFQCGGTGSKVGLGLSEVAFGFHSDFAGGVQGALERGELADLRTMTYGRGQFSMEFSHYAPCPKNVSDDVIAKAKAKDEDLRAAK